MVKSQYPVYYPPTSDTPRSNPILAALGTPIIIAQHVHLPLIYWNCIFSGSVDRCKSLIWPSCVYWDHIVGNIVLSHRAVVITKMATSMV